jgi:diguanylate cyclase (GGDEF)-like protein
VSDPSADQSWATAQLVEFLAGLAGQATEADVSRAAVEGALDALDAEIGALLDDAATPIVAVGLRPKDPRLAELAAVGLGGAQASWVDGLGECRATTAALAPGSRSDHLLVVRLGDEAFPPTDLLLLRGMAWVLELARRQLRLVTQLHERQRILERLSRVQRDIAARVPLPEVFEAVTNGALSLIGSEYALLYLFEQAPEPTAVSVSRTGTRARPESRVMRLSSSLAREVHEHGRGVRRADLTADRPASTDQAGGGRTARRAESGEPPDGGPDGRRSGLGVPVRGEGGAAIGSLVVVSPPGGSPFGPDQERALLTFADQVSVALSDARGQIAARHAVIDQLTGLPNRVLFLDQLDSALESGTRTHAMFIDLDNFKEVNDTLGHAAGDDLLRAVVRRLRAATRAGERLARFGGDEFALLLQDASDEAARACAQRLVEAMRAPFQVDSQQVHAGCSIGLAAAPPGTDAADVLRNADTAMYRAKRAGGGRVVVFDPLVHSGPQPPGVVSELRRAVGTAELRLVYQPIVGLRDGQLHAVEALVRWDHPTRGVLSPREFIPLAEQAGLIVPLGRAVLATACAQAAAWSHVVEDAPGPSVSVNISGHQLRDAGFLDDVRGALADARLDPDGLVLEITERTATSEPELIRDVLRQLRDMGIRLAVDDVGAGAFPPTLRGLPVEVVKVDQSLVEDVARPGPGRTRVRTILEVAGSLSMTAVAEGIETQDQVDALLALGCEIGQGYLLARPMSPADVVSFAGQAPSPQRAAAGLGSVG